MSDRKQSSKKFSDGKNALDQKKGADGKNALDQGKGTDGKNALDQEGTDKKSTER